MSLERARAHLARFGLDQRIIETAQSSATVELAAQAVGTQPERIAKSLSFLLAPDQPILVVAAGDARTDNRLFKDTFSSKPRMTPGDRLEELIGHAVGGVCPFGINPGVPVYLDESLHRFSTVFPACGNANSAIELSIAELEQVSGFERWVSVTRTPDPTG